MSFVESTGPLPAQNDAYKQAWNFPMDGPTARVLDPFSLLKNKLGVNREKDQPHIVILQRFVREHVEGRFTDPTADSRARITSARCLLDAHGISLLPPDLFEILASAPLDQSTRRFLVNVAPSEELATTILAGAPADERGLLQRIAQARRTTS